MAAFGDSFLLNQIALAAHLGLDWFRNYLVLIIISFDTIVKHYFAQMVPILWYHIFLSISGFFMHKFSHCSLD